MSKKMENGKISLPKQQRATVFSFGFAHVHIVQTFLDLGPEKTFNVDL